MGIFSRFEGKIEDTVEGAANSLSNAPISPVQISRRCERQMIRNKMVGAGKQYAPTLFTVLVNPDDDSKLCTFYPTLAGEIETYLRAKAGSAGLYMDGQPLVRFIVDDKLKHGKFDVIAEVVASGIVYQLREEEMQHYGIVRAEIAQAQAKAAAQAQAEQASSQANRATSGAQYGDAGGASEGEQLFDAEDPFAPHHDVDDPFAPLTPTPSGAGLGGAAAAGAMGAAGASAGASNMVGANNTTPQQKPNFRLECNDGKQSIELTSGKLVAGRASDCDIVVSDINASRKHAEFSKDIAGRWVIRDLGSKNGTLVNGEFVQQPTVLYEGDSITLGLSKYTFTRR